MTQGLPMRCQEKGSRGYKLKRSEGQYRLRVGQKLRKVPDKKKGGLNYKGFGRLSPAITPQHRGVVDCQVVDQIDDEGQREDRIVLQVEFLGCMYQQLPAPIVFFLGKL